ncbi:hypothetical protein CJO80_27215 (plasmid) [Ralstonia solanacearum]|nr:hypothetical protein CJO80_27215 [Ralstonia solanacearum]
MHKFCHFEDCSIERTCAHAELRDEEGRLLLSVPSTWSDKQIQIALAFANRTYAKGVEFGKDLKSGEVRACLGILNN